MCQYEGDKKFQRESDFNIFYEQYHQNLARNIQYFKILKHERIMSVIVDVTFYNIISILETKLPDIKILKEVEGWGVPQLV